MPVNFCWLNQTQVRISCTRAMYQPQPLQLKQQGHSSLFQHLGAASQMRPSSTDVGMKVKYRSHVSS
uniref:Uncharacterized protein n=1 Tax=Salix viminalis TaxID=40686 RepID=A0A6N2MMQ3_SALVM